jgi:hypothetical protein
LKQARARRAFLAEPRQLPTSSRRLFGLLRRRLKRQQAGVLDPLVCRQLRQSFGAVFVHINRIGKSGQRAVPSRAKV